MRRGRKALTFGGIKNPQVTGFNGGLYLDDDDVGRCDD